MITKRSKCIVKDCNNPVLAKGYCKYHQYLRNKTTNKQQQYKKGISRPRIKNNALNIAYRSKKRSKEETAYIKICHNLDNKAKGTSKWICYFCGKPLTPNEKPEHHHLKGRDGNLLTDEKYIVFAHHKCHVQEYHAISVHKIYWFKDFLKRLKKDYPELYDKENEKLTK